MSATLRPVRASASASASGAASPSRTAIAHAVQRATRLIAPVWPLKHFVAVNPFLGVADKSFADAAQLMAESAGARLTMPRRFYADAIRSGRVTDAHLVTALASARHRTTGHGSATHVFPHDAAALKRVALDESPEMNHAAASLVPTVADVLAQVTNTDWPRIVEERLSAWAAAHFDEGLSSWHSPWRALPLYCAWHAESQHDRTAEVLGLRNFRTLVGKLPATANEATAFALSRLGVSEAGLDRYLARLLLGVGGWAAYARYHVWESELYGNSDDMLADLLAVRLAWEVVLLDAIDTPVARNAWREASATLSHDERSVTPADAARAVDLVLQDAYEIGWQNGLVSRIAAHAASTTGAPAATTAVVRPNVQAAFCIDVRSEVYRRALERADTGIETIGFAGFFGFSVEYIPLGQEHGGAQCPVLLTPGVSIAEAVHGASAEESANVGVKRNVTRLASTAWRRFKMGAVSCFGFVGPVGLAYLVKLISDTMGRTRPVANPANDGLSADARSHIGPTLTEGTIGGRAVGIAIEQRAAMAQAVLGAMSMHDNFARVILLAGHGSTTVNNPHATGLDCGACGGHTGEANARIAVAVLNDPTARAVLAANGRALPDDTVFVAGLHDTTTDDVQLFDLDAVPATHAADIAALQAALTGASQRARVERAPSLGITVNRDEPTSQHALDAAVRTRSRDWSQVRPEWGLAGCAAFVAAPRHRTTGVDFGGRSFLHSYDWTRDEGFGVLELIMTAPVVVASWISLQYFGSTVDNVAFGCGNKTLHNVVGTMGVFEGNGGPLRTGLPWQSLHDGTRLVHEPLRLNVVIEAPLDAMNAVLRKHDGVRALADNGWLHLWALNGQGAIGWRYIGDLQWAPAAVAATPVAA